MGQVIDGHDARSSSTGAAAPVLELRRVIKNFAGTRALSDVSLRVRPGTVHALLGGNGSGKSTTIKILAGVESADEGELSIFGRDVSLQGYTPAEAQHAGLRFVHQDLGLFDDLSIEENFALDSGYPTRLGGIHWRGLRRRVSRLLEAHEVAADPRTQVRELRPADRTLVAIARALQDDDAAARRILVLDEPTARLAAHESAMLLETLRRRAAQGQTVIIVSHRLREVLEVCDDVTVYRDGRVAAELVGATPTENELIELMAGRAVAALRPTGDISHAQLSPALTVRSLRGGPIEGIDFTVHRGEILGLTGLVGSGRSSVLRMIFGEHRPEGGTMVLDGAAYAPESPQHAMNAGVALVPEDRVGEAVFMDRSVSENIALGELRAGWRHGFMLRRRENALARDLMARFAVKAAGPEALLSSMSGGNQQKVVLARWLRRRPRLLLLDEPTQGVDVMSRADIYRSIRESACEGSAVLVASSDPSEIHALCDRVVVLAGGVIVAVVAAGDFDIDSLTSLILRDKPMPAHLGEPFPHA